MLLNTIQYGFKYLKIENILTISWILDSFEFFPSRSFSEREVIDIPILLTVQAQIKQFKIH